MDAGEWLLAKHLHRVGVEDHPALPAQRADLRHRLKRPGLVVGRHHAGQHGVWAQGVAEIFHTHPPLRIHRQTRNGKALFALQVVEAVEHRVMLDAGRDEVPALVAQPAGGTKHGQVAALRAAAGENHLARLAGQPGGHPVTRVIQQGPGTPANLVDAGRVAPNFIEERQHRRAHL